MEGSKKLGQPPPWSGLPARNADILVGAPRAGRVLTLFMTIDSIESKKAGAAA